MAYQIEALETCLYYFKNLDFQNPWIRFQTGALITIRGTILLFWYLRDNYGIDFLITSRLIQDYLERYFGELRRMGGNNTNPSALQLLYRMQRQITTLLLKDERTERQLIMQLLTKQFYLVKFLYYIYVY